MRRLLVLLACCCSSSPPTRPPGGLPLQARRGLPGYPGVVEPSNIDCRFVGPWGPEQPTQLRFGDEGPVYATAFQTEKAQLEISGTSAFVEIEVEGYRFWGHVDRPVLHPARAFVLGGYLVPGFHATLRPVGARPHELAVEITPPRFVKPLSPPREWRPCTDLGLAYGEFHASSALGDASGDGYKLPASTPIALAAAHGGPPVAELTFGEEAVVSVIEQRGEHARIFVGDSYDHEAGIWVVGWVARSLLVAAGGFGQSGNWSMGSGPPVSSGLSRARRHVRCTHEVPLIVELAGERHLAGAIRPGTTFGVNDGPGETLDIVLDRVSIQLAPGARPMVKQSAIAACTDIPR